MYFLQDSMTPASDKVLKATVTLTQAVWSGWDRDGYCIHTWAKVQAEKGRVLGPATLGTAEPEGYGFDALRYEIEVQRIVTDRVAFAFRKLVVKNPGGGINLTLPNHGHFILRCGETTELGTPTMDSGISVTIELHEIALK